MSYVKYMILCFDYLIFNLATISVSELRKVHDYCMFDYFFLNLVTITVCELRKGHYYCVLDYFLFNLVTFSVCELHKVCLTIKINFSSISAYELHNVHDYFVFDY